MSTWSKVPPQPFSEISKRRNDAGEDTAQKIMTINVQREKTKSSCNNIYTGVPLLVNMAACFEPAVGYCRTQTFLSLPSRTHS